MSHSLLVSIDTTNPAGLTTAERTMRPLGELVRLQGNVFELWTDMAPSRVHSLLRSVLGLSDHVLVAYSSMRCAS